MDCLGSPGPFPLFQLPAELRNMIYRLVVVVDQCLVVRDMHLEEFCKSREVGTYQSRSTYLAPDHVCTWLEPDRSCLHQYAKSAPLKTTYTLGTQHANATMTTTMLSLDKQSREEVASIFYRENTFRFPTMSSLMPFMKDRTTESRKYIQHLWLSLIIDAFNWDAIFVEYGRPAIWNTIFSSLLKLSHVNIRKLCIQVLEARKPSLLYDDSMLRSRSMIWLHKLSRFEDLKMLGLQYTTGLPNFFADLPVEGLGNLPVGKTNTASEDALWRLLAPRMLKKEADDHSPDALQRRRIRDFSNAHNSSRTNSIH